MRRPHRSTRRRARSLLVAAVTTAALAIGWAVATSATAAPVAAHGSHTAVTLTAVSNPHPQYVSGGDVLLQVDGSSARPAVTLNGRSVSSDFVRRTDGTWLGLVDGLRRGHNTVVARSGSHRSTLAVDNHPITGPVFAGRQQTPFYCETTAYGLPAATPPECSAPTSVTYQYKSTDGSFKALADPAHTPSDLATATVDGRSVPYIVRLEQGTIDRAVYQVAALWDGSDPSPYTPDTSWNGRLVYTFGGGCNAGFHQGATTGGVMEDAMLSQGYAVASSSLNVLDQNCNIVLSAEAAMMVKEHVIETYGPVAHTIGWGGSGGAIQQYNIADAYPGILDGIIPTISFPDVLTTLQPVADCALLERYYAGAGASLTDAQRRAIEGFTTTSTCGSWVLTFANRVTATGSCPDAVPADVRWNPTTNPTGVKCDVFEQLIDILGRKASTGYARRTVDNVGVQYGLAALKAGAITPQQFIDLNASIGGFDANGNPTTTRSTADRWALRAAYRADLMNAASQGLKDTAIIDQRWDLDRAGIGNDIHTSEWSFVVRARLQKANDTYANQVIIANQPVPDQMAAAGSYELNAMDRWLTAVDADPSHRSLSTKIIRDKPADLGDGCYLSATERILEPLSTSNTGRCGAAYPVATNTRIAAGASWSMDNTMKCSRSRIDFSSYGVRFTAAQKQALRAVFPTGVCDYAKPGVLQEAPAGTWRSYGPAR